MVATDKFVPEGPDVLGAMGEPRIHGAFLGYWGAFLACVAITGGAGFAYYQYAAGDARDNAHQFLAAIAATKVQGLTDWRASHVTAIRLLVDNPLFQRAVEHLVDDPEGTGNSGDLDAVLESMVEHPEYDAVFLFDRASRQRRAVPADAVSISKVTLERLGSALASDAPVFVDFHLNENDYQPYIVMLAPIRREAVPTEVMAVLALRINPQVYLYPYLARWPVPTESGITKVVRREGATVLYLNPTENDPLKIQVSIGSKEVPAVQAILGATGPADGVDYRGIPVVASLLAIPDTPWYLVAKLDTREACAALWALRPKLILAGCALVFFCAVILALLARQQAYRHRARELESQAKLNRAILHAPFPALMYTSDGTVLLVNDTWRNLTGYGPGELQSLADCTERLLGRPLAGGRAFTHDPLTIQGRVSEGEFHVTARDGVRRIWELYTNYLWKLADGRGLLLSMAVDITELKAREAENERLGAALEQRVEERTAELLAANQDLDSFAYSVSHDLRAPLRGMTGFSQALLEDYGDTLTGEAHSYLDQIVASGSHMGQLIDGILTLSRSTRGELRRDPVDLSALAERLRGELESAEPDRVVTWDIQPGVIGRGDGAMLEVLLRNLIGNAWKYSSKNGASAIRFYTRQNGESLHYCVADNGAGFDMKHADKLFKPFQRLHRQDEFVGIGIGLATAQRIVHRHGGTIEGTAVPGGGAEFAFTLPYSG